MSSDPVASSAHPLDTRAASRDLWPGGTLRWWRDGPGAPPERVWWPEDEDQVAWVLAEAARRGAPVVPYGAGSGVCGGARGLPGEWVLDLKRLDAIGEPDRERWTVDVEAGVLGQHLEDHLAARGFTLGHSPSSIACSTVGGWAAARSAGQFSSRYGVFEDMVDGLVVVTPDGRFAVGSPAFRASRPEPPGPDAWMPLLLGSEGTLGVITRLRLKIWPSPAVRWLRGYRFDSVEDATAAMRRLMQEELWPAVVRLYDPVDTRIGGRTRPTSAETQGRHWLKDVASFLDRSPAWRHHSLSLPLRFAPLVNHLFDGLASGCLLVVGWEGAPDVVSAAVGAARPILEAEGEDLGEGPGERWFHSRHNVSYKLIPLFVRGGFADTMEIACRWSALVPAYRAVRAALGRTSVVMAHMSHVYPEGASIYFSFAGAGDEATYRETWRAALSAALRAGANTSHHHGIGRWKSHAAARELGDGLRWMRDTKASFDPAGHLAPGRLFSDGADPDVVDVAAPPAGAPPIDPEDGLVAFDPQQGFEARCASVRPAEPRWAWSDPRGPRPWHRLPWRTGIVEVVATDLRVGRGPRSAVGPDVRELALAETPGALAVGALATPGPRWLGEAQVAQPWSVARSLLRADLRPAVLTVRDGKLFVGFRGAGAEAFGAVASALVPGGLRPRAWLLPPEPVGPFVEAPDDDPAVVAVLPGTALRLERP